MYLMSKSISLLVEFAADKGFEFGEGLGGIAAVSVNGELCARTGSKHHETHDTFAVNSFAVFFDIDFAVKTIGGFDKHGGGARVDAKFV